jgi:hypothetical protein
LGVFGTNYPNEPSAALRETGSLETGAWRIEVSSKKPAAEHLFLNVMQVTDAEGGARWPVSGVAAADRSGCRIDGPACSWLVLFRREAARSGAPCVSRCRGTGLADAGADLAPAPGIAQREESGQRVDMRVDKASGAAWFEAQPATGCCARPIRGDRSIGRRGHARALHSSRLLRVQPLGGGSAFGVGADHLPQ